MRTQERENKQQQSLLNVLGLGAGNLQVRLGRLEALGLSDERGEVMMWHRMKQFFTHYIHLPPQ